MLQLTSSGCDVTGRETQRVLIEWMSEKCLNSSFLEYNKSICLRKNTVFLLNQDFLILPVTSQPPFPALLVSNNAENSSVAIVSINYDN